MLERERGREGGWVGGGGMSESLVRAKEERKKIVSEREPVNHLALGSCVVFLASALLCELFGFFLCLKKEKKRGKKEGGESDDILFH